MKSPLNLSKSDARRAMVRHHFTKCDDQAHAFDRLRSIQFDPIAPVGCNHDLVLQARVPGYKVGDWQKSAYDQRLVYDGWDKCACLIPFAGWPVRRIYHKVHRKWFEEKIFRDHKEAVELVMKEITDSGPMMPRDFNFQERREEWKGSWFGPSVTKQVLKALWHSGELMTSGRKNGQHLYDLSERVVPLHFLTSTPIPDEEARQQIALDRHRAIGLLRPNAASEVWSHEILGYAADKKAALSGLLARGEIVPVEIEGVKAHATPDFLSLLDRPSLEPRLIFVAPLDQFMWDRKMIRHLFGFDYIWEIYTPEAKRKWGYYVLPVLFEDALVARAEFYCRNGVLEVREWRFEDAELGPQFMGELEKSVAGFMQYCSATHSNVSDKIDPKIRDMFLSISAK